MFMGSVTPRIISIQEVAEPVPFSLPSPTHQHTFEPSRSEGESLLIKGVLDAQPNGVFTAARNYRQQPPQEQTGRSSATEE